MLDFLGNDGEALTGFAGPGGLDGCIEGEQVGLFGNLLDDGNDVADPLGGPGQVLHFRNGAVSLGLCRCGRGGRVGGTAADLGDGRGHFLGRGGNRFYIAGCRRGSSGCGLGLVCCTVGHGCQRVGRRGELGCRVGNGLGDSGNRALEAGDEDFKAFLTVRLLRIDLVLVGVQPSLLDQVLAETFNRASQFSDLVTRILRGDGLVQIALADLAGNRRDA